MTETNDNTGPDQKQNLPRRTEQITPLAFEPSSGRKSGRLGAHRWLTITAFGVFVVLASLAIYLFTGHSVLISFDPPAKEVQLDGALINFKLADRWLLHSGNYTVTASLPGYHPFEQNIEVSSAPQQEFLFSLKKLPGFLDVNTRPEVVSEVRLDGLTLGATPVTRHEIESGTYELEVFAPRYQPFKTSIDIAGGGTRQEALAELVPAWAQVTFSSEPGRAVLWVDGEIAGETPFTASLLMGNRELELRLSGYKTWIEELRIPNNQPMVIDLISLEKADNLVRMESRPGRASVTVDGNYRGETPLELEMKPGRDYQILFNKAGYTTARRVLFVEPGAETNLNIDLKPVLGQVLVGGEPDDALLYVDGDPRGTINQTLQLTAIPHQIEVRKDGYESFQTKVTPNPDLAQEIDARLRSLEEIRLARTPLILKSITGYELRLVRASGTITMGSARREQGRKNNEFLRQVSFKRPFYMGIREITNGEMTTFLRSHDSGVVSRQTLSLAEQPAVRMSWDDAARFCNWLSKQDGLPAAYMEQDGLMVAAAPMNTGYRLPSEAEWALVARYAGDTGKRAALRYPWGSQLPPPSEAGNFAGQESSKLVERAITNYRDRFPATAPVGVFPANELGIFDLGGNVREWLHDFYAISIDPGKGIPLDTLGPEIGAQHVIRGSGWRSSTISNLRLAWRGQGRPPQDDVGFRVARYAE